MSHKMSWSQRALRSKGQPLEDGGDGEKTEKETCTAWMQQSPINLSENLSTLFMPLIFWFQNIIIN